MSFYLHFYLLVICTSLLCFSDSPVTLARQSTAKITYKLRERLLFEHKNKSILRHIHYPNKVDEQQDIDLFRPINLKGNSLLAQTSSPIPPKTIEPTQLTSPTSPDILPKLTLPPQLQPSPMAPEPVEKTVRVNRFEVLGSTVFSPKELNKFTATFTAKNLSIEQLLEIRTIITNLYVSKGYKTSGAFLPRQNIFDGVVQIQIVEGQLERIEIKGLKRLREGYVRSRFEKVAQTPVNFNRLQEALQLLQLDPLFSRVQAELVTGTMPGSNVLILELKEAPPLDSTLTIDNSEPPSVGEVRGAAALSYNNLLGVGDHLSTEVGITEGVNSYNVNYAIPVNARNGTLNFTYNNGRNRVTEEPFAEFDIQGRAETYSLAFRQPLTRSPTSEFALTLTGDLRRSRTFFDNEPYSFTKGLEKGKSRVSVIRFSQDWVDRSSPNRVLAARSQFSVGLNAFDATVNDTGTDGRFFSWLGQFQWVQALNKQRDFLLIASLATQFTPDSLLPIEQFSIGGPDTIRGYRTNQQVGDNGFFGSFEMRVPIMRDSDGIGLLQVTPFFDIGTIWNNGNTNGDFGTLASTGLGLRWQISNSFSARIDWGIPLVPIEREGDSLQDKGLSFSLQLQPF